MKRLTVLKQQRLDIFLQQECPGIAPGLWHKYWRQNKIKVSGKRLPLNTKLSPGSEVCLYLPPPEEALAFSPKGPGPLPPIVFEDEHLLVLQKPAGLVSVGHSNEEDSLLSRARFHTHHAGLQLSHRLDTGTSGLVILCKTEPALQFIESLLREHRLEKQYLALCLGALHPPEALCKAHLQKDAKQGRVWISAEPKKGSKPIETAYRTLQKKNGLCLLQVCLHTGRTHQIRAHLAFLGAPILGDSKYGLLAENRRHRCRYQCLCAVSLRFPADLSGPFARYRSLFLQAEPPWFVSLTQ